VDWVKLCWGSAVESGAAGEFRWLRGGGFEPTLPALTCMKSFWRICFLVLLVLGNLGVGGIGRAQPVDKPPGGGGPGDGKPKPPFMPKPPNEGGPQKGRGDWRPGDERGDRRGVGDHFGPGGRPPMFGEGFEKLSEDQKSRVREALGKAWGRPEVSVARDRMMKANEEMREAIHSALKEIDPEIATLLASMRGPEPRGGRGEMPKMPDAESPDFPGAVVRRLEMELLAFSPPERREEARKLHERLLESPEIREAVEKLNAAPVRDRVAAMEILRRVYREGVGRELGKAREKREGEGAEFRRPPEEAK